MCGEIRKPCQPSKLRTDCYVNDSTGVLQQVVSSLLCTYKIMIRWVPKHMKDTGDLFSKICDMDNLRKAHKNAKRGKLKRELDEFMAVNLKQVLKHNWQVFPTKVRGVDFVGYRFFGEYTLLRKSTCKTFKRRMLSISSKRENNVSPTYSEWCSFNSYVGWLQHCDSFRLYQKYVEPNVEYMHNYYLKEVKGNAEICKRKNYSGERKAS